MYGLLHFEKLSGQFFQCDGENWIRWSSKDGSLRANMEVSSARALQDYESPDLEILEVTTKEATETTTSQVTLSAVDNCLKGAFFSIIFGQENRNNFILNSLILFHFVR